MVPILKTSFLYECSYVFLLVAFILFKVVIDLSSIGKISFVKLRSNGISPANVFEPIVTIIFLLILHFSSI